MKKIFIFAVFAIFCSCGGNQIRNSSEIEIIMAKSDEQESVPNLFEQFKIIPLETTDLSLVGRYIRRIEVWDNKIFVQNNMSSHRNILCFDLSGKYLFNIDKIGHGPGEYTYLDDFFIDKYLNHLVFFSEGKKTLHFDMHGKFLYNIYANDFYEARHSVYLNDSTYLAFSGIEEDIALNYIDSKTTNIRSSSNSINEPMYYVIRPLCTSNDRALCLTFSDSIYDVSDINSAKAKYTVYYSETHRKLKNIFLNRLDKMTWEDKINFKDDPYSKGEYMFLHAIHENTRYIALSGLRVIQGTDDSVDYAIFYDKVSKKTYDSKNIDFGGFKVNNFVVAGVYNDAFYCVLYSDYSKITDNDRENIKNSQTLSSENKKSILEHDAESDNPLLFVLK